MLRIVTDTVRFILIGVIAAVLIVPVVARATSRRRTHGVLTAEGDRVRVRPARTSDIPAVEASMDDVVIDTMGWSDDDVTRFIDAMRRPDAHPGAVNLAVELLTGDVVGVVSLVQDPTTSVQGRAAIMLGFWIAPGERGRGIGTAAVGLAHTVVAELGGSMSSAHTSPSNVATQNVLERNGFERHGSYVRRLPNGADVDAHMYRRFVT